jgi:hypothetical protein
MLLIADRKVIKATPANEDHKDYLASKDLLDPLDPKDLVVKRVSVVFKVKTASKDQEDHKVLLDRRDRKVFRVSLDLLDQKANKEILDRRATLVFTLDLMSPRMRSYGLIS